MSIVHLMSGDVLITEEETKILVDRIESMISQIAQNFKKGIKNKGVKKPRRCNGDFNYLIIESLNGIFLIDLDDEQLATFATSSEEYELVPTDEIINWGTEHLEDFRQIIAKIYYSTNP